MSPKSLLRHPQAQSPFADIGPGTKFQPVIGDIMEEPKDVEKVVLCSGKVYFDIVAERKKKELEGKIAVVRVEQLCPFPYELVKREVARYPKSKVPLYICLST